MTKIHEAFYREDIIKLSKLKITDKGELTVILSEEIKKKEQFNENKIINKAKIFLKRYSLKDTVDLILETEKISRKKVYKICLRIKNEKN